MPVAVLAAKRAANTGREVIVVTSFEPEDDLLAGILADHGLKVVRGSLNDVLGRFITGLEGLDDEEIIFRLTADNAFPDGRLLDEMEEDFVGRKLRYMCCAGPESGLPYGVSAEVMRVGELRKSSTLALSSHDREHVTSAVIRQNGRSLFLKRRHPLDSLLRSTIDNLDDYLRVEKAFNGVSDPVNEPCNSLVERLRRTAGRRCDSRIASSKLVLGTAQWGGPYGIANVSGVPDEAECRAILRTALENGIVGLDTARAYGNSEKAIGASIQGMEGRFTIMTKLSLMEGCPKGASRDIVSTFVDASVMTSCYNLRVSKIDVLMLHRLEHFYAWGGSLWKRLLELKSDGLVTRLGVSVQTPDELESALMEKEVEHIQMPWNLLDRRWDSRIPDIEAAKASRSLSVHVRSTLLQGILASRDARLWEKANVPNSSAVIEWLESTKSDSCHGSVSGLCIAAAMAQDWVDGVVVGMETDAQLQKNLENLSLGTTGKDFLRRIKESRPILPEDVLNPALWPR